MKREGSWMRGRRMKERESKGKENAQQKDKAGDDERQADVWRMELRQAEQRLD